MEFVLDYMESRSAVDSYMKVYPKSTRTSAFASSSRILSRKDVQEFIDNYLLMSALEAGPLVRDRGKAYLELLRLAYSPAHLYPQTKYNAIVKVLELSYLIEQEKSFDKEEQANKEEQTDED